MYCQGTALPFDFRRFAPATAAIEAAWSTTASSGDAWLDTPTKWGTNTGPALVRTAGGFQAVKKPGLPMAGNMIAAREKIAADLAYLLELPVPPVTLWDTGCGVYAAVSALAFVSSLTWGQAQKLLTGPQTAELIPAMSAMIPFESWIDAQDRQNEGNVLVGIEPTGRAVGAWIDYTFSMDHVWQGNMKVACAVPPQYPPVGAPDAAVIMEVAEKIATIKDAEVEEIINRIPGNCLPAASAASIRDNLLARRAPVRALW